MLENRAYAVTLAEKIRISATKQHCQLIRILKIPKRIKKEQKVKLKWKRRGELEPTGKATPIASLIREFDSSQYLQNKWKIISKKNEEKYEQLWRNWLGNLKGCLERGQTRMSDRVLAAFCRTSLLPLTISVQFHARLPGNPYQVIFINCKMAL